MSTEIIIVLLSLVAMLAALIMDKMRPGMILFSVVVIFLCTGILTPKEMLEGFSNKGMITVAMLFLISEGVRQSNALSQLIKKTAATADHFGLPGTNTHAAQHCLHFRFPEQYPDSSHFCPYHQTVGRLRQTSGHLFPDSPFVCDHSRRHLHPDWHFYQPGSPQHDS